VKVCNLNWRKLARTLRSTFLIWKRKLLSAEARNAEIATESKKSLDDFQGVLIHQLERVHDMYAEKIRSISALCLVMPAEEPSADDYLSWLSEEVSGLPDVFSGVNENFTTAATEGVLTLADDSIDLKAVWAAASEAGADILPAASGVRRAARAVSKKWWRWFGYDYVLSAIHAQQVKVFFCFWVLVCVRLLTLVIVLF
jgi:hypothetical protein